MPYPRHSRPSTPFLAAGLAVLAAAWAATLPDSRVASAAEPLQRFASLQVRQPGGNEPLPATRPLPVSPADWPALRDPHHKPVGTLSCSSASCHGRTEARRSPGNLPRHEYLRWLESDPHAGAVATLDSDRFRLILERMSQREDGQADVAMYRRCAACHDPLALSSGALDRHSDKANEPFFTSAGAAQRGIGCESCHGAAGDWLARHYESGVTPAELHGLGMIDTNNLLVRGRTCASCHVGSLDQDMNHDMIAAGHPPLRFELSAYHDLIQRKHWDDTRERLETPDFQAQLWAAGQIASAEASLALLEGRAQRAQAAAGPATKPSDPAWPEFAEFNCFACHQRFRPPAATSGEIALRPADARRRLRKPGIPAWNEWNLTGIENLLDTRLPAEDATKGARQSTTPLRGVLPHATESRPTLTLPLDPLRELLGQSFAPDATQVAATAGEARRWIHRANLGQRLALRTPGELVFTKEELLEQLKHPPAGERSWEASCQAYVALVAAQRAYRDEVWKLELAGQIDSDHAQRLLAEQQSLQAEMVVIRDWLAFERKNVQWPMVIPDGAGGLASSASEEPVEFYAHRAEIERRLQELAKTLHTQATMLPALGL